MLLSFVGGDCLSPIIGGEFHHKAFYTSLIILNKQLLDIKYGNFRFSLLGKEQEELEKYLYKSANI